MPDDFDIAKFLEEETDIKKVKDMLFLCSNLLSNALNDLTAYKFYVTMFKHGVDFEQYENPLVSIVIPVKNEFNMTQFLLNSIHLHTNNIPYEVIIADDNSTDQTIEIQKIFTNIKVVKNDITTPGFLYNVTNAIKQARGEYILLLNNDMVVLENYLSTLLNVLQKHNDIGIAGSKTLYTDNKIQECGVILKNDGIPDFIGAEQNHDFMDDKEYIDCDYCSGCAILFRRSDWERAGGFDKNLAPAYYEDSDFAFNLKYNYGLKSVCVPQSKIYHFRSITYNKEIVNKTASLKKNKEYFLKKWINHFNK